MKYYGWLMSFFLLFACGTKSDTSPSKPTTEGQKAALLEVRQSLESWTTYCEGSIQKRTCDVGDSMLWNGMACLTGDVIACDAVKRSQGADGRLWRSPQLVENDATNSSSRDMLLGFLAYLVATKDQEAAQKFLSYLEAHGKLCDNAEDNRCDLDYPQHAGLWGTIAHVWSYIGLTRTATMSAAQVGDDFLIESQALFVPAGFQKHLVAVALLVRKETGHWNTKSEASVKSLLRGEGESNPLLQYLAGNWEEASTLTLEQAPSAPVSVEERTQWALERDTTQEAWKNSIGHDYLFMIRLLLRP